MTAGTGAEGEHETLEAAEEQLNALLALMESAQTLFSSFAEQSDVLVRDQDQLLQLVREHNEDLDHGLGIAVTDAFTISQDGGSILNTFQGTSDQAISMLDHLQAVAHDLQETQAGAIREDLANFTHVQTDTQQALDNFDAAWQTCKDALQERLHEVTSLAAVFLSLLNESRQKIDSFHSVQTQIVDLADGVSSRITPVLTSEIDALRSGLAGMEQTLSSLTSSFAADAQVTLGHIQAAGLLLHDELNQLAQHMDDATAQYTLGDPLFLHTNALQELQDLSKAIHDELFEHDNETHTAADLSLQMEHFEQEANWLHNAISQMHTLLKKLDGDKAAKEHAATQSTHDALGSHAFIPDEHLHDSIDNFDHFHA